MKAGFRKTAFRDRLLAWYEANARDLPWRESRDPYRVWVSEIMLQQTRVAAVIEHYHKFLRRFPTVQKLAAAREGSVLAAWSGLGYYRRARTLHAAAKVVARERGGEFPETAAEWRTLPGVGRYTAAAIASIALGEAVAVVDGNVERVLQRISEKRMSGEELWEAAEALLARERPGDFNQAMMELGATVCTPVAPACLTCPVMQLCATRGEMAAAERATRQQKREIHYALHQRNGEVLLVRRARDASLMAGMWELPEAHPTLPGMDGKQKLLAGAPEGRSEKTVPETEQPLFTLRHSITVTDYSVRVWNGNTEAGAGEWISARRLPKLALTGLARKVLRKAGLLS